MSGWDHANPQGLQQRGHEPLCHYIDALFAENRRLRAELARMTAEEREIIRSHTELQIENQRLKDELAALKPEREPPHERIRVGVD